MQLCSLTSAMQTLRVQMIKVTISEQVVLVRRDLRAPVYINVSMWSQHIVPIGGCRTKHMTGAQRSCLHVHPTTARKQGREQTWSVSFEAAAHKKCKVSCKHNRRTMIFPTDKQQYLSQPSPANLKKNTCPSICLRLNHVVRCMISVIYLL